MGIQSRQKTTPAESMAGHREERGNHLSFFGPSIQTMRASDHWQGLQRLPFRIALDVRVMCAHFGALMADKVLNDSR